MLGGQLEGVGLGGNFCDFFHPAALPKKVASRLSFTPRSARQRHSRRAIGVLSSPSNNHAR
jgi:hypothetical protein